MKSDVISDIKKRKPNGVCTARSIGLFTNIHILHLSLNTCRDISFRQYILCLFQVDVSLGHY